MSMERQSSSGGHGGLYFLVGGLCAVVAVLGYFILGGNWPGNDGAKLDVNVTVPDGATGGGASEGDQNGTASE